jgi:hypothetical protein
VSTGWPRGLCEALGNWVVGNHAFMVYGDFLQFSQVAGVVVWH